MAGILFAVCGDKGTRVVASVETERAPRVLVTEGASPNGRPSWRHYFIPRDGGATLIEMEPATFAGWNIRKVTEQGAESWEGQTAEQIVAWKLKNHGGPTSELPADGAAHIVAMLARWRSERAK